MALQHRRNSPGARAPAQDETQNSDRTTSGARPDEVERAFDRLSGLPEADRPSPLDLTSSARRHHPLAAGVRRFLAESEGTGYSDYFKPSEHLMLSVMDAVYRTNHWVQVPEVRIFKLRLLLAGQIIGAKGEVLLTGPQALLHLSPGASTAGYYVAGGQETKLVVLHFRRELLEQTLGLTANELPPPIDAMLATPVASSQRIGFSAEMLHAAQRIVDSRHGVPSSLRCAYLESMATSILCEVLAELSNRDLAKRSASRLSASDLNRVYEARDYLAQHFAAPPTIPQLARMVGINQTKLKAAFKQVFGLTIYQYILERRMELASELLLTHDYNVTEIAYRVGYQFPANFTHAFRKRFGCLPRVWRRR